MNLESERFEDDAGDVVLAPEDEVQGVDIGGQKGAQQGAGVAEGRVAVQPDKEDEIQVYGETLTPTSSLANLRAACSVYGVSTSRGKAKIFKV